VIKRGGVVFKYCDPDITARGLRIFREIQEDTPCVVLMEDLDSILRYNRETDVINLLDGVDKIDKVVFLATTNYPEQLGERVINRPSRFDRRYFIGPPNSASRELFFKFMLDKGGDKKPSVVDVPKWVKDTDGMSIAHLKELFVACVILDTPYKQAIETLKAMDALPNSEDYKSKKMARVMRMDDAPVEAKNSY
jgi:SpoVK/Ycf46/Vps4 family AAA+-type ATPase